MWVIMKWCYMNKSYISNHQIQELVITTHSYETWLIRMQWLIHMPCLIHMTRLIHVPWLIHMTLFIYMRHVSFIWHDSFTWHDSFIWDMTHMWVTIKWCYVNKSYISKHETRELVVTHIFYTWCRMNKSKISKKTYNIREWK